MYGDLQGGWAFEWRNVAPASERSKRRVRAENQWLGSGAHIFRLPGIYGPERSPFEKLRNGDATNVVKDGQVFSRIHVEDIARAILSSMARPNPGQTYNIADDAPAPPHLVTAFAGELLGIDPGPPVAFANADLSPMARSFYAECKRVPNARAKSELGWMPQYRTYREGLRATLEAEEGLSAAQNGGQERVD